ncbi:LuxR C-terminal-related transcriptional regulator [Streptomyces sp. NPDC058424]|uniref:LuxR C-terminal-related transcriptional regulator n=1 Tax=Streptomyces sp. NPDC058424 TaxID=3346491 RepID=UPI003647F9E7
MSRGTELLKLAAELINAEENVALDAVHDLTTLDGQLAILTGLLRERLISGDTSVDRAEPVDISTALADAHTVRYEIRDFLVHERLRRLDALDAGLASLRKAHDPEELLNRVCEAVSESCGFDRVMLSRVEDSVWRPWKSYAVGNRQPERAFRKWISAIPEIRLDHLMLESEMVRRHKPALVTDGERDPRVYRPLLEASGLSSYVAAPLMPTGRVIGFLHADYESEQATPLDRDILWAFAGAFGQIFERAVLLTRLHEQREQVRMAMQTVTTVLDDLASAEIDLAARAHATALTASRTTRIPLNTSLSKLESLLTARELEVLSLMATGATNDRIAEQLVISNGTVKSHVKRILRKLRAENRSEAISQYLRLTIGEN